jgi:hypothetical protein
MDTTIYAKEPKQVYDIGPEEFPFYEVDPPKPDKKQKKLKLDAIPQGHGSKLDANTLLGIPAYVSPTPNCLVPLDPDGKFPLSTMPIGEVAGPTGPAGTITIFNRAGTKAYTLYVESDGSLSYDETTNAGFTVYDRATGTVGYTLYVEEDGSISINRN